MRAITEDEQLLAIILSILFCITIVIVVCTVSTNHKHKEMAKMGYEQVIDRNTKLWQKSPVEPEFE